MNKKAIVEFGFRRIWRIIQISEGNTKITLSRDVIGRPSVKSWFYWLWRLVMLLVRFDPSIVTVRQSFIVSQIVSCPIIIS